MRIKVEKREHENAYFAKRGYNTTFTLVDSIVKTHFKALMKLAKMYDSRTKTGYILDEDRNAFDALVIKIEKSNDKVARKSHEKSVEKARARRTNLVDDDGFTLEDYIEEFGDLNPYLMSREEKEEWIPAFLGKVQKVGTVAENKEEMVVEVEDKTNEIVETLKTQGFEIEKGENGRYFLVKSGKTEGELMNVLSDKKITVRFDKNEFGTTLSIPERSGIHNMVNAIYE